MEQNFKNLVMYRSRRQCHDGKQDIASLWQRTIFCEGQQFEEMPSIRDNGTTPIVNKDSDKTTKTIFIL